VALTWLHKVSGLAHCVHDTSVLKEKFNNLVQANPDTQCSKSTLDHHVSARWNSNLSCLDAHVHFRPVVEQLTALSVNKLKAYWLTEKQWELAEEVQEVLVVSNTWPLSRRCGSTGCRIFTTTWSYSMPTHFCMLGFRWTNSVFLTSWDTAHPWGHPNATYVMSRQAWLLFETLCHCQVSRALLLMQHSCCWISTSHSLMSVR